MKKDDDDEIQGDDVAPNDKYYKDIIAKLEAVNAKLKADYAERNLPNPEQHHIGAGIINTALNYLPMPEMHLFDQSDKDGRIHRMNFVGPFTKLDQRLKDFDPATCSHHGFITEPINDLDEAAYKHDLAYCKYTDLDHRHSADIDLQRAARAVYENPNKPMIQRANARVVEKIMQVKRNLDQ